MGPIDKTVLPKQHVVAAVLLVVLLSVLLKLSLETALLWLVIAAIVAVVIDFDHVLVLVLYPEKIRILFNFPHYLLHMEELRSQLHFKGYAIIRFITHFIWGGFITLVTLYYFDQFFVPVVSSFASHLALDVVEWTLRPDLR